MPELPEVETIVRDIRPPCSAADSARLAEPRRRAARRHPPPAPARADAAPGRTTSSAGPSTPSSTSARDRLVVQPGMTGSLVVHDRPLTARRARAMRCSALSSTTAASWSTTTFAASARSCSSTGEAGSATRPPSAPSRSSRGSRPSGSAPRSARSRQAIKKVIMDQRHLAGVGNIYANEALFAAGHRSLEAGEPAHARRPRRLHADIRRILRRRSPRRQARSATTGPAPAQPGNFQLELLVYGREGEPCVRCGTRLAGTHEIDARITVFCHRCQRERPPGASAPLRSRPPTWSELRNGSARWPRTAPRSTGCSTRPAASSTSARPSGSAPGCSPTSARAYPDDKAARILYAARTTSPGTTCPASSPPIWPSCARSGSTARTSTIAATSPAGRCSSRSRASPAPRVYAGEAARRDDARCYGPFRSRARTDEAVRTLNDLLGLRDCAAKMPIVFAGQGDLFDATDRPAACATSSATAPGPAPASWRSGSTAGSVETAVAFLEGRTLQPLDRVITAMQEAADAGPLRARGALAREVRAARVAAGRDQPRAHRRGSPHLRVSRSRGPSATIAPT